jgi:propanol-preferring alcohol dehydrogenase
MKRVEVSETPKRMRAMVLESGARRLRPVELPVPQPGPEQVLVRVHACGVCRTDLHILDAELREPRLPLVPGHEIVGRVAGLGNEVRGFRMGERVGIPWLGHSCGRCRFCARDRENLCENALFTGYTLDGGYAEFTLAHHRYCFPIAGNAPDAEVAPLLCAGLIGYRSYRMTGEHVERLGIYGFGAAAHIVAQIAIHEKRRVFAFTSPGDTDAQQFAVRLGAVWAGDSTRLPPEELDAAIIFAPVGPLVPQALTAVCKGGSVVCAGIHMSDIPAFPYRLLWGERIVRSVANLTRRDGEELLRIAPEVPVRTEVELFNLEQANEALDRLRAGRVQGAAVLTL